MCVRDGVCVLVCVADDGVQNVNDGTGTGSARQQNGTRTGTGNATERNAT